MEHHSKSAKSETSLPQWRFVPIPDNVVSQDVTQRDQFSSENTGLYESLVREATQNSTDQPDAADTPVHLVFNFSDCSGEQANQWRHLTESLKPHCEACDMDVSDWSAETVRVLAIEDFNTTGLTGSPNSYDGGNFEGFWRRHGGSNKGAGKGGSHGLGKLVFSASSNVGAIFGLTIREDKQALLLGQAVLNSHTTGDGRRYPPHGFWTVTPETGTDIQEATANSDIISEVSKLCGFKRDTQKGLSIAVPFLHESVTADRITEALLTNYFFQIIAGTLTVDINGKRIDKDNFFQRVEEQSSLKESDRERLSFVKRLIAVREKTPEFQPIPTLGRSRLSETFFHEAQIEDMRKIFKSGGIVSVRMPVPVIDRTGAEEVSYVDIYLTEKASNSPQWALYVRGSLVISEETRHSFRAPAYGAVIASDERVAALLRDSENPAHTRWMSNSEKLNKKWKFGPDTVKNVKLAPSALHEILTRDQAEDLPDLLINFMSLPETGAKKRSKKRTPAKPKEPIVKRKRLMIESPVDGGFRLSPGPGAPDYDYPKNISVHVAYDILSGDPIKTYSPLDFDLKHKSKFICKGNDVSVTSRNENKLVLELQSPDFKFELTGFDNRRDLIVKPKAIS